MVGAFDKWWTTLEDAGLRPFWTETNFIDVSYFRRGANVVEVSTILYLENVVGSKTHTVVVHQHTRETPACR
jgi:hypothetical protein